MTKIYLVAISGGYNNLHTSVEKNTGLIITPYLFSKMADDLFIKIYLRVAIYYSTHTSLTVVLERQFLDVVLLIDEALVCESLLNIMNL